MSEFADRRAAGAEPFEDGAAGGVGEGCEGAVDSRRKLNHWVHYTVCRAATQHSAAAQQYAADAQRVAGRG